MFPMKPTSPVSQRIALLASSLSLLFVGCTTARLQQATMEMPEAGSPAMVVLPKAGQANPAPVYPVAMRQTRTSGEVNVDCVIDENGRVLVAYVQNATNRAFVAPTLTAVRKWTFEPGTRDGVPAAMRVILPVEFTMID